MNVVVLEKKKFLQHLNIHSIINFNPDLSKSSRKFLKNRIKDRKAKFGNLNASQSNTFLPSRAHQILLGSLLGDMHCRKEFLNAQIEEAHSMIQKDYATWKYANLKDHLNLKLYALNNPICKANGRIYTRKREIRLRSGVSENLNIYHELFYRNNKKIIHQDVLDQLGTLALAVWYCDDGYYDPENKTVSLHTEGFSVQENELIKNWFNERWKINPHFKLISSKKKISLRFPITESRKFLNLVNDHIFEMPQSMWYKLGYLWDGNTDRIDLARLNKIRRTKSYQSRIDVMIKRNQQSMVFYQKNKGKILERVAKYRKTKKYRVYMANYHKRPDVKKRMKASRIKYRQKQETKRKALLYSKEYRKRPEVREKIRLYNKKAREKRGGGG